MPIYQKNPLIKLKVEYKGWGVLFNPAEKAIAHVNPVGVSIWNKIDGKNTVTDIVKVIRKEYEEIPGEIETDCNEFIEKLLKYELISEVK